MSTRKLVKHTAENAWGKAESRRWGQSRTYKRSQILKILAAHMINHTMVAAAGGAATMW